MDIYQIIFSNLKHYNFPGTSDIISADAIKSYEAAICLFSLHQFSSHVHTCAFLSFILFTNKCDHAGKTQTYTLTHKREWLSFIHRQKISCFRDNQSSTNKLIKLDHIEQSCAVHDNHLL